FGEGVMLHELYHALQDQQFDLSKIEKRLQSEDHRRAFHAVVEGEAMLAVSELMNYDFLSHVRYGANTSEEMFQKNFNYGEGMKFVKAIREKGGWDAVGRLYSELPLSTAVILSPQRYLSGDNNLQSLSGSVKAKRGERLIEARSEGAYGWMLFLAKQAPEQIEELVTLYREDRYIRVEKNGQVHQRWTVGFDSVDSAKRVQESLESEKRPSVRKGKQIVWEWR
ncbi:MAG: hypothetical protein VX278_02520, partial [Myxococcota bacterium]|nr:hypothetical protein [Myxococcota bacterium]